MKIKTSMGQMVEVMGLKLHHQLTTTIPRSKTAHQITETYSSSQRHRNLLIFQARWTIKTVSWTSRPSQCQWAK